MSSKKKKFVNKDQPLLKLLKNMYGKIFEDEILSAVAESQKWDQQKTIEILAEMSNKCTPSFGNQFGLNSVSYDNKNLDADVIIESMEVSQGPNNISYSKMVSNNPQRNDSPHKTGARKKVLQNQNPKTTQKTKKELEIDRVKSEILKGYLVMVILRGLPGSGKSTLAKSLVSQTINGQMDMHIFSTDDYFIKNGVYRHNPQLLSEAHNWNQMRVSHAAQLGISPIIVDNTNTQAWEIRPYAMLAVQFGYIIEILEPNTPWCNNVSILTQKNTHNVTKSKINDMSLRFENFDVNFLMKTYKLNYGNRRPPILRNIPPISKIQQKNLGSRQNRRRKKKNVLPLQNNFSETDFVNVNAQEINQNNSDTWESDTEGTWEEIQPISSTESTDITSKFDKNNISSTESTDLISKFENSSITDNETNTLPQIHDLINFNEFEMHYSRTPANFSDTGFSLIDQDFETSSENNLVQGSNSKDFNVEIPKCHFETRNSSCEIQSCNGGKQNTEIKNGADETKNFENQSTNIKIQNCNCEKQKCNCETLNHNLEIRNPFLGIKNQIHSSENQGIRDRNVGIQNCDCKTQKCNCDTTLNRNFDIQSRSFEIQSNSVTQNSQNFSNLHIETPKRNIESPTRNFDLSSRSFEIRSSSLEKQNQKPTFERKMSLEDQIFLFDNHRRSFENQNVSQTQNNEVKPQNSATNPQNIEKPEDYDLKSKNNDPILQNFGPKPQNDLQPQNSAPKLQNFGSKSQNYELKSQNFDSRPQSDLQPRNSTPKSQYFGPKPQNDLQPLNFGPKSQNLGLKPQNYTPNPQNVLETQNSMPTLQNFGSKYQNYGTKSQNYDPKSQNYDSKPLNDLQAQNYGSKPQNFGSKPQNFGLKSQNYESRPQHDLQAQNFGSKPQNYDSRPLNDLQAQNFGPKSQSYDSRHQHDLQAQNFGPKSQNYESRPQNDIQPQNSEPKSQNLEPQRANVAYELSRRLLTSLQNTFLPQSSSEKNILKKSESVEIGINTSSLDLISSLKYESGKILVGVPRNLEGQKSKEDNFKIQKKLMLEKGTMTDNDEILKEILRNDDLKTNFCTLLNLFPQIEEEILTDIFVKCQIDVNWTVDILLENGLEVSHENQNVRQPKIFDPQNFDPQNFENLQPQNFDEKSSSSNESQKSSTKIKFKPAQDENTKKILNDLFKIPDEHYSDHILNIRKKKFPHQNLEENFNFEESSHSSTKDQELDFESEDLDSETENEFIELNFGREFINQLEENFGNTNTDYVDQLLPVMQVPRSLACQLHALWMESVYCQMEMQSNIIQKIERQDLELAKKLQDEEHRLLQNEFNPQPEVPSLQEIMDMELALAMYRSDNDQWKSQKPDDMATRMTKQKLFEAFPDLDKNTLCQILQAHDNCFEETVQTLLNSIGKTENDMLVNMNGKIVAKNALTEVAKQRDLLERTKNDMKSLKLVQQNRPDSDEDSDDEITICKRGANYYRDKAAYHLETRQELYQKANEAIKKNQPQVAGYYLDVAKLHLQKYEIENNRAASAFLSEHSMGHKDQRILDLHYLYVKEAEQALAMFLDGQISRLQQMNKPRETVFIITGRGKNSAGGKAQIKPVVKKRLKERKLNFAEMNPGSLKVIISKHSALTNDLKN